ncbi:MAG: MCE family protein [Candidatus Omnitrophica bacterium]|nr:MCE family protein [Candidatus Omnitrophota bacterium]MBI5024674.1 MCE family protein [Candidatus Omnitrophota bacterium]
MPKEKSLEFKVGFFVLLALIGLAVFIFSITDSPIFEGGKTLKAVFNFANGLKKSAPVRIAGVDQGIVKEIKLFFDPHVRKAKAEIVLWVKKDVQIPQDSTIMINQLGLMGEKYIEITPGADTREFLQEGQVMVGIDPIAQEAIAQKVMEVASGLDKMISDEKTKNSISATLENLSLVTGNLRDITSSVKDGKGTLGRILYDERLYDDLQGLTADLKTNPWKLLYRPKK